MDPSLLDLEVDPQEPVGAAGPNAPAGMPSAGVPVAQYTPPSSPMPSSPAPTVAPRLPAPQMAPPPAGLPPPSMAGPAGPAKSVSDKESTYSSTRTKVAPEERAAQAQLDRDNEDLAHAARVKGQLQAQEAEFQAQAAARKQEILRTHGEALQKVVKAADDEWNRADQRYQKAFETARHERPKDFWGYDDAGAPRKDTGSRKFWAGVAMALGGFTERTNGRNTAYEMISDAINRRDRMEQERIGRMREDAQSMKGERDIVLQKKHEKIADLTAQKAAALDQAAAEVEQRLMAMGKPKAEAETNETVLKLRQDRDQARAQFAQVTRQEIRNQVVTKTQQIVGGPGTAQQDKPLQQWKPEERKAEGFAMRAWKSSQDMDAHQYSPADMQVLTNAARREALNGGITGMADKAWKLLNVSTYNQLSPEGKKRWNATREFIVSGLRPESGAAISMGELADAEQRYGVVPGDTKASAPQKREMRNSKIAEVGLQSGRPQFWIEQTGAYGQQPSGAAAKPGGGGEKKTEEKVIKVRNKATGQEMMVRVGPDGRYYPVDQVAAR